MGPGENPLVEQVRQSLENVFIVLFEKPVVVDELFPVGFLKTVDFLEKQFEEVEPRNEDLSEDFLDSFIGKLKRLSFNERRVHQIQSDGVGSVLIDENHRIGEVFLAFAHFLAVFRQDESVHNQIFVRRVVVQGRGDHVEGVEPSSGLVQALSDEVGGESLFELLLTHVFGVAELGVGHGPGLEPTIENFGDSLEHALALFARNFDFIHEFPVQVLQFQVFW